MSTFEIWKQLYENGTIVREQGRVTEFATYTSDYVPCIMTIGRHSCSRVLVTPFDAEYMKVLKDEATARTTEPITPLARRIINIINERVCFPHSKITKGVRIR